MTDAEIYELNGPELDAAVFKARGWTQLATHGRCGPLWRSPTSTETRSFHDLCAAFDLLMGEYGVAVEIRDTTIAVISRTIDLDYGGVTMRTVARGPKHQASEIMLRAWLKLHHVYPG